MLLSPHFLAAAGLFAALCETASANPRPRACGPLEGLFPSILPASSLVWPSDAAYKEEISEYWSTASQAVQPKLIIRPVSAKQASKAIKELTRCNIPFAIRSGGHSPSPGTNTSPSVLIATTYLNNKVVYNKVSKTATVGPGLTWGYVYDELLKVGRTCVGGREQVVGVGGLLLGGGLSHLSPEHGLAADNVVSYEVVLSNGKILKVTANSHADLFWALKGGSNRLAFVTAFTINTYPSDKVWGGVRLYSDSVSPQLDQALYSWLQNQDPKSAGISIWARGQPTGATNTSLAQAVLYYNGLSPGKAFAPFDAVPNVLDTTNITTHVALTRASPNNNLERRQVYTGSFKSNPKFMEDFRELFWAEIEKTEFYSDPKAFAVLVYQNIGENIQKSGSRLPLGLEVGNGPDIWYETLFNYADPALDTAVLELARRINKKVTALAKERGLHVKYLYLNDANSEQPVFQSYGEGNLAKLRNIARKYDSKGTFRLLVGGFEF